MKHAGQRHLLPFPGTLPGAPLFPRYGASRAFTTTPQSLLPPQLAETPLQPLLDAGRDQV